MLVRRIGAIGLLAVIYVAAGGFFIVPGNEAAVVRRFGRAVRPLRTGGWHFDWPRPFATVDRLPLNTVQTLSWGGDAPSDGLLLDPRGRASERYLMTGDQHLLRVRYMVQLRVDAPRSDRWLFSAAQRDEMVRGAAEAAAADLVARSGVDFAHTQGLSQLNQRLTEALRTALDPLDLGVIVDRASLERVGPPAAVVADFLDVADARSDSARAVLDAEAYAAQRASAAGSDAPAIVDAAHRDAKSRTERARGMAESLGAWLDQLQASIARHPDQADVVRQRAADQRYRASLRTLWSRVPNKTILPADGSVDVTLPPR